MRLLILILLLTAPVRSAETLGKIGDIELRTDEIREALAGLEATQESALTHDPAAVGQYVRALLIQRLLLKKAIDAKFDQDPAVIAKLVRAREAALTEAYLQSFATPPAAYPDQSELQAAYEAAKPTLLLPKTYRLAQIFTKDKTQIESLAKQLKSKPADFPALARTSSQEKTSAANGGEIGWLTQDQLQPAIRDQLPKLSPGQISPPLQINDGWHLIKLLEIKPATTATLDQIRPQLITRLRTERAQQMRQQTIADLLKENPLAINEIEIGKLLPKSP